MDELEQAGRAASNAFMHYNHMKVTLIERDHVVVSLDLVPESLNPYGAMHGGAYYTMADCAGGAACRTDGRHYVTLYGGLNFIHAAHSGRVNADARVRHRGRSTCVVTATLSNEAGTLLASGDFTFFCVGEEKPRAHD